MCQNTLSVGRMLRERRSPHTSMDGLAIDRLSTTIKRSGWLRAWHLHFGLLLRGQVHDDDDSSHCKCQ